MAALLDRGAPKDAGIFEAALRLGIAQLFFLPERGDHSAIHLAVETAKSDEKAKHYAALMNGVLRNAQRRRESLDLPEASLLPGWLATRWRENFGEAALAAMIRALIDGPALDLTVRPDGIERVKLVGGQHIIGDTWRIPRPPKPVFELPGYAEGEWWVQDASAAIPARLLRVEPFHAVADLCAAPGGKTAQLALAGGAVSAVDTSTDRLARLAGNLQRVHLDARVKPVVGDAIAFGHDGEFDRVLLDAPCTATGIFRRHPEVIWHRKAADIAPRAALQSRLLDNAARIVRKGGVIVYAVCSLEKEEGEEQASRFLARHDDFTAVPVEAEELSGWTAPVTAEGNLRTLPGMALPNGVEGTLDGFFAARFLRLA
jgi:16S rRNA (cytosine967-C5)-methyltransferase